MWKDLTVSVRQSRKVRENGGREAGGVQKESAEGGVGHAHAGHTPDGRPGRAAAQGSSVSGRGEWRSAADLSEVSTLGLTGTELREGRERWLWPRRADPSSGRARARAESKQGASAI